MTMHDLRAKLPDLYSRLNPLLRPLAPPYAALMRIRRGLYERGLLPAYKPSCVCISVGNIAFGGTGKSPLVGWLLEKARREGKKAVVLSRGYGGKPGQQPLLVSPDTPVALCGDEPLMLARRYPWATILVHPERRLSARLAEERYAPDWLILDDGMQHLALERSLNLTLLRPEDLGRDWGRVIPSGPWREGPSALAAASAFLLRCDAARQPGMLAVAAERLGGFGRPVFSFDLEPLGLRPACQSPADGPATAGPVVADPAVADSIEGGHVAAGEPARVSGLGGRPYILLSGVGKAEDVERGATRLLGYPPLRHFAFADHQAFGPGEARLVNEAFALAVPLVCTAKDAVKLECAPAFAGRELWILEAGPEFGPALPPETDFSGWLDSRLRGA